MWFFGSRGGGIEFLIRMSNPGKSWTYVLGCVDGALDCISLFCGLSSVWPAHLR